MLPLEPTPKNVSLRLALLVVGAVLVVATPVFFGSRLPLWHDGSQRVVLREPRAVVYRKLADLAHWNRWNPHVGPLEPLGNERYRTRPGGDTHLDYVLRSTEQDRRVVVSIEATPPKFGATWTLDLRDYQGGTRVTIREHGWVESPTARFVMGYITGYDIACAGIARALSNADQTSPR